MVSNLVLPLFSLFATRRFGNPNNGLTKLVARTAFPNSARRTASTTCNDGGCLPLKSFLDDGSSALQDADGNEMSSDEVKERLANSRVALYFAAGWCPMCTNFEPSLLKFRQAALDSGKGPLEIIYVSSDRNEESQKQRVKQMNMMNVKFDGGVDELKEHYKIWAGSESMKFGFLGRRSGVPALVVLDKNGEELTFLPAEAQGASALGSWPLDDPNGIW
mmetsp:Transcript_15230/g.21225  ORF Transcript_15230/g.21225 Transcript_15230/m.21225 type:complete len:219 (+) Transcript_15230:138-794(+)